MIYGPHHIGRNLTEIRRRNALTQDDVADKLGTTRTWISRLENGHTVPSLRRLCELSDLLGVSPCDLLREPAG